MVSTISVDARAAVSQLMNDFSFDSGIKFLWYRARPTSIRPPQAFIDRMTDRAEDFLAPAIFQHITTIQVLVLHGIFDQGDTVDQRDRFVDGFWEWVRTRYHAAGANTLIRVRSSEDDPSYVPEWIPERDRQTYYGTFITLEVEQTD